MQLENSFTVPVPIDEAWRVLTDIERIAPCMPGAALDSVDGDDFTGRIKVKLGPINLTYQGKASFTEKDEAAHRAVLDARGKDQRGNGTAAAVVTATLAGEGASTRVDVVTDLSITGRPAQFGRGVMTDVGNKLLGQFADKLAAQLAAGDVPSEPAAAEAATSEPAAGTGVAATVSGAVEEIAASLEQTPGDSAVARTARKAGTAAKETAAAATDATDSTTAAVQDAPAAKPAARKTPAAKATPAAEKPAARATSGAKTPAATTPAAARPSAPPAGPSAPPARPATGGPAKSTPAQASQAATPAATPPAAPPEKASPVPSRPQPAEPEPIDLLDVAGGAVLQRYAAPLAGAAVLVLLIAVLRRRRR